MKKIYLLLFVMNALLLGLSVTGCNLKEEAKSSPEVETRITMPAGYHVEPVKMKSDRKVYRVVKDEHKKKPVKSNPLVAVQPLPAHVDPGVQPLPEGHGRKQPEAKSPDGTGKPEQKPVTGNNNKLDAADAAIPAAVCTGGKCDVPVPVPVSADVSDNDLENKQQPESGIKQREPDNRTADLESGKENSNPDSGNGVSGGGFWHWLGSLFTWSRS